jgi:hypothetical protein
MNSFFKKQRQVARRTSTQVVSNPTKILMVGPSQNEKKNFVKSFLSHMVEDSQEHELFSLGVEISPIEFGGKKYNLWDANPYHDSFHDENLISSGKGAKMILVFAEQEASSWFDRMKKLFPQIPVKMYNPDSKLENLM